MMTSEQWTRVKEVFHAALAQEPGARAAFAAEACGGDESVRAEVERLLEADAGSHGFLDYSAADTLLSGRVIGHYEIGRLLGTGGMGRVYAARDQELDREVALKVAAVASPDAQARLRREAQHASRLSHPHICHVYDVGRADGQLFVVMELVAGRSLAELLREGPLPIAQARRYGREIADALAHAHEHGVMHRDLKGTNVMVTPKRGAKVLDFGLARRLDAQQLDALSHSRQSVTADGLIAGTLPYMSPELLRGQTGDQRTDIWALGVLLYEMVSGRHPFTGATGFELSAAILHQPPAPLPATVPASIRAVIHRCLEKNPEERFADAAAVQVALEEVTEDTPPRRLPRMSRRMSVTGLLLILAALAIAVILQDRRDVVGISNSRGYGLLARGEFEQAIDEFQGAAEDDPDDANAWDSLGEGYLASGMPQQALEAFSRALTLRPAFEPSRRGRGLALAALGRYDDALAHGVPEFTLQAFLLSRVGRYREAADILARGLAADDDEEVTAGALLTSAWLRIERQDYARAREDVRAAAAALDGDTSHRLGAFATLIGGIADVRAGDVSAAAARLTAQSRDGGERPAANWLAALEGEIALARGDHDRATSRFQAARTPAWITLGGDTPAMFAISPPLRDGLARVEIARGNPAAAIKAYRGLTAAGPERGSTAALEPRHVLALARLLHEQGDRVAARAEYERFLALWARADEDLPELKEARHALANLPAS